MSNIQNNKNVRKNLSKKEIRIFRIITSVLALIILANAVFFMIYQFTGMNSNFYIAHILLPIILLCVGAIAIILPYVNTYSSYSAQTKGDKYMVYIGIGLMFAAIIAFIITFMA